MAKNSNKKRKKKTILIIFIILSILIISIITLAFVAQRTEKHNFYDKDLGWVSSKVTVNNIFLNWITSFFGLAQRVTFSVNTIQANSSSVTLTDAHTVTGLSTATTLGYSCKINNFLITVHTPTGDRTPWGTFTLTTPATNFDVLNNGFTLTPSQVGTYSATTVYSEMRCNDLNACQSSLECPKTWSEDSSNTLTSTSPPITTCTNQNRYTSWSDDHNIDNGIIQKRTHITVGLPPSCSETVDDTQYQTSCSNNYHCSTTSSDQLCSGQDSCILNQVANQTNCFDNPTLVNCTSPQVCNPTSKTCQDPVCNSDQTINCSSSTLTIAICNNGTLTPISPTPVCNESQQQNNTQTQTKVIYYRLINNSCQNISLYLNETTTNDYTSLNLCQVQINTNITNISCYTLPNTISQVEFGKSECKLITTSDTVCDAQKGYYPTNQLCIDAQPGINYILYGSILGIIIVIILIIIVLAKMKRRKK